MVHKVTLHPPLDHSFVQIPTANETPSNRGSYTWTGVELRYQNFRTGSGILVAMALTYHNLLFARRTKAVNVKASIVETWNATIPSSEHQQHRILQVELPIFR